MNTEDLSDSKAYSEVDLAFRSGKVGDADEETLERCLAVLCEHGVKNPDLKHREIIRGITINHIQMKRVIEKLDAQNTKTQRLFLVVAVGSLFFTALGVVATVLLSSNP